MTDFQSAVEVGQSPPRRRRWMATRIKNGEQPMSLGNASLWSCLRFWCQEVRRGYSVTIERQRFHD